MRSLIITLLCCFALVMGLSLFCGISSRNASRQYQERLEEIQIAIQDKQWNQAKRLSVQTEKDWKDQSPFLSMWVHHDIVDSITIGLSQLIISIENQEEYHTLLYLAEIGESVSFIYQKDAFSLKNIL